MKTKHMPAKGDTVIRRAEASKFVADDDTVRGICDALVLSEHASCAFDATPESETALVKATRNSFMCDGFPIVGPNQINRMPCMLTVSRPPCPS